LTCIFLNENRSAPGETEKTADLVRVPRAEPYFFLLWGIGLSLPSGRVAKDWGQTDTGVPQKRPTARDVQASPSLRRDLLSFGSAFGEPVTAPHVAHTWSLGWTVGSIGGDALTRRASGS